MKSLDEQGEDEELGVLAESDEDTETALPDKSSPLVPLLIALLVLIALGGAAAYFYRTDVRVDIVGGRQITKLRINKNNPVIDLRRFYLKKGQISITVMRRTAVKLYGCQIQTITRDDLKPHSYNVKRRNMEIQYTVNIPGRG